MNQHELTDLDRHILEIASHLTAATPPGRRERYIREQADITPTRFYQHLNALLDHPAAAAGYPLLVNRLRRIRDTRRTARTDTTIPANNAA